MSNVVKLATVRKAKAKPKRSAIRDAYSSGLELVEKKKTRGKLATDRELAKLDFDPWEKERELLPSTRTMDELGVYSRAAYGIMMRSKAQLIESHQKMSPEVMDKLMGALADTCEKMKALASMVDTAYMRVLASAAAYYVDGGKVKQPKRAKK